MKSKRALTVVQKFYPAARIVRDANRSVTIEVTAKDLARSSVRNHRACAMAEACKRKFNLDGAVISRSIAYLITGNVATRYKVPNHVSREIVAFDRGGTFSPGVYRLKAPDKYIKLGVKRSVSGKSRNDQGYTPTPRHTTTNIRTSLVSIGA